MKKILHILLLAVYLPAALGVGFNIHSCGGEVEHVDVFTYSHTDCCGHDMQDNGCCNDDWKFVKLDDNSQRVQPASTVQVTAAVALVQPLLHYSSLYFQSGNYTSLAKNYSDGPPPGTQPPVYLKVRSILI